MAGVNLFIFGLLVLIINESEGNVIVKTKSGEVEGVVVPSILKDEKYYSFMGIPYAEPPIGKLRFMPPVPHSGWNNVLKAVKEPKSCAQFNFPARYVKNTGFCGEEDCLKLSIHTPKLPRNEEVSLPVLVFLTNEKFRVSRNGSKDFGPDFFMKEDVIVVTINHRLGSLGFLTFGDDLLPGNNGIKDVILALKWLSENIHNFGGDSLKLTLMGHQDGAVLVEILLHSPKAKGLFSAAILQSGTLWSSSYFIDKKAERAIELANVLEQPATTSSYLLKRFENVNPSKLTEVEHLSVHADDSREYQRPVLAFGPVLEHDHPDAVITDLPENKPLDIDIPIMIGYNSREGIEYVEHYLRDTRFLTYADRDFLVIFPIRTDYHFKFLDNVYRHVVEEIKEFYFDEAYVKVSKPGEYITYMTDIFSFYPIDYAVRKYTNESRAPVYYYIFDYSGELNARKKATLSLAKNTDGTWGANLGDELCYLFVCKDTKNAYIKALEEDDEDIKVLRNMVRMWTNFAKTRNPNPVSEDFVWQPATRENKECLLINEDLTMKTKLQDDKVKFWDDFIAKYRKMAVNGIVRDEKDEL